MIPVGDRNSPFPVTDLFFVVVQMVKTVPWVEGEKKPRKTFNWICISWKTGNFWGRWKKYMESFWQGSQQNSPSTAGGLAAAPPAFPAGPWTSIPELQPEPGHFQREEGSFSVEVLHVLPMGNEGAAASDKAGTGLECGNQKWNFGVIPSWGI